jgi:hypothetical protein
MVTASLSVVQHNEKYIKDNSHTFKTLTNISDLHKKMTKRIVMCACVCYSVCVYTHLLVTHTCQYIHTKMSSHGGKVFCLDVLLYLF